MAYGATRLLDEVKKAEAARCEIKCISNAKSNAFQMRNQMQLPRSPHSVYRACRCAAAKSNAISRDPCTVCTARAAVCT
eukprot:376014-Rhodomonas_salina.1